MSDNLPNYSSPFSLRSVSTKLNALNVPITPTIKKGVKNNILFLTASSPR